MGKRHGRRELLDLVQDERELSLNVRLDHRSGLLLAFRVWLGTPSTTSNNTETVLGRIEEKGKGGRDKREDDGMHDEHREGSRVQDSSLESDVQHNEFHETEDDVSFQFVRPGCVVRCLPFATH